MQRGWQRRKKRKRATRIYNSWNAMISRCKRPEDKRWKHYGGRGIKVCRRWLKFKNFAVDMGPRPRGKTLDRINNNGNYTRKNCRWISNTLQQRNRNNTRLTEAKVREIKHRTSQGERQRLVAIDMGVSQSAISRVVTGEIWKHAAR